jgi:hypothetical protein
MVPGSKADEYLMRGNCAAPSSWLRLKIEGIVFAWRRNRFNALEILTFWVDIDVIRAFAGDDFSLAKYRDVDSLIEKESSVRHYEISLHA